MGALSQALPREHQQAESAVKSDSGYYKAQFLGLTDPYEWVTTWGDKCRNCKGQKTNRNGDQPCFVCKGSGLQTEQRVKIQYKLENGNLEEEEVNFKLSAATTLRDGQPISPSKLFIRLRTLSGNRQATPAQLDEWYSSLKQPIRIPCNVVINGNKSGTAFVITDVLPRQANAPAAAPVTAATVDDFDDSEEETTPF
jgi:hypothetical protein